MARRPLAPALLLAALSPLAGCAVLPRALSSPAEYEAYRRTRVAYTIEDRLTAAEGYLRLFPAGRFAAEVRGRFGLEEKAFYARQAHSIDGLDWYRHVLPDGPHATEASFRLLELEEQSKKLAAASLVAQGRLIERRLARAAELRKDVSEIFLGWVSGLSQIQSWGRPTYALPAEIRRLLRGWPDPGRCDDLTCVRQLTRTFSIPVAGGGIDERAATMDLVLNLDNGGVAEGALRGPDLFSRLWEADRGQPIPQDALLARSDAVGYALEVVSGIFEAVTPQARCEKGITPPVVLRRACDGWTLTVTVGDTPGDDDIIAVRGPLGE